MNKIKQTIFQDNMKTKTYPTINRSPEKERNIGIIQTINLKLCTKDKKVRE